MPINRPQVTEPHFFKDQTAAETAPPVRFQITRVLLQSDFIDGTLESFLSLVTEFQGKFALGHAAHPTLKILLQSIVAGMSNEFVQVIGDGPDILGNTPFIIVENADKLFRGVGNVV